MKAIFETLKNGNVSNDNVVNLFQALERGGYKWSMEGAWVVRDDESQFAMSEKVIQWLIKNEPMIVKDKPTPVGLIHLMSSDGIIVEPYQYNDTSNEVWAWR